MVDEKVKVLVVDDDKIICDVLENALSERSYELTSVYSGSDALYELKNKAYDVVLLDIGLPGMSGLEVLTNIWLHHKGIATIMITGVDDTDTAVAAMKTGANDYIVKPFDLDRVDESIRKALLAKQAGVCKEQIDAIARGVEAQLDPSSTLREMITERTVNIAKLLGIAEEEIQRWAVSNVKSDSKTRDIMNQPSKH